VKNYPHRCIDGRMYREVSLQASDTKEAARHVSAERPISARRAREIREEVER
jgi:hypothetical protein